ncbi:hypothetical protein K523DRAFT_123099 [Schizophyllum commune Tattone D]|nr:hypothetical protein K523DRAFT_123099 [Schizophyllum commune Tattone D]
MRCWTTRRGRGRKVASAAYDGLLLYIDQFQIFCRKNSSRLTPALLTLMGGRSWCSPSSLPPSPYIPVPETVSSYRRPLHPFVVYKEVHLCD